MAESINVEFETDKETPGTLRFKEIVAEGRQRGVVGSIYVLKADLEAIGSPKKILVTITPLA